MEFPETNLRTYVLGPKGPGIWFFSLDAARAIAVAGARIAFGLPYYLAQMSDGICPTYVTYASKRDQASVAIRIAIGPAIEQPSLLDSFLTARFRLYSMRQSKLISVEVEHPPWKLNAVRVLHFEEGLRKAAGLEHDDPPLLFHHSHGVDVKIGLPVS